MDKPKKMLSRRQAALELGVSDKTLDKWIANGLIPAYKLGDSQLSLVKIKAEDLYTFLDKCKITA